jgi:hypothetical protein
MGNTAEKTGPRPPDDQAEGQPRHVNYLVTTYSDVKDVVFTVEKLITQTPVTDKSELRQACDLTIIPLQNRSGYVFRLKLHDAMIKKL